MPRYFTLAQAQALLPEVQRLLRRAVETKAVYQEAEGGFRVMSEKILASGGMRIDPGEALRLRGRRDQSGAQLREAATAITELGVQIKDLDAGLIDFPTLYRGREVLLCYRLGEKSIAFWHGLEEGFRGRKRITAEFRANHRGDQPN